MKKKLLIGLMAAMTLVGAVSLSACGKTEDGADSKTAENVVVAGSTSVQPLSEALAETFMSQNDTKVEVQGGGSGQAAKSLDEGIADIGALSRDVKDEEKTSVANQYIIAKDGVAVVVNKDVTVSDLTMDQIKDIYTGKIKNWKKVGGADKPITVVSREEGSGTRGAFTELTGVLVKDDAGNETDNTVKTALVQSSTGAVAKTVASTPDSIGYISLGAMDASVKAVKVEGVDATVETVLSNQYKIQRPFIYAVGKTVSAAAQKFIDFAMGAEGQKIVKESGFIPVQ